MQMPPAIKKFITGPNLFNGVLVTLGAVLPGIFLFQHNLLLRGLGVPIGYIFTLQADVFGPIELRKKGLLYSIATFVAVILIAGISRHVPGLIFVELLFFGFLFSMISVIGNRGQSIGTLAMLLFIFNMDDHFTGPNFLLGTCYLLVGCLLYCIVFFLIAKVRPYFYLQQQIGQYLADIGNYLKVKNGFFQSSEGYEKVYQKLMQLQVTIKSEQDDLRIAIFQTRQIVNEINRRGRAIMLMYLDSIDLLERIMTTQQDYKIIHQADEHKVIVNTFSKTIDLLADALQNIGITVQAGLVDEHDYRLEEAYQECKSTYYDVRNRHINASNIDAFFALKQILFSIHDIVERIDRIQVVSQINVKANNLESENDLLRSELIVPSQESVKDKLLNNISFKSSTFKHSLRVVIALVLGFFVSEFLPVGHSYWILMTIVVILKPVYSISRQRNLYRMGGTILGIVVGVTICYLTKDTNLLFVALIISMIVGYSMLKINYMFATMGITLYVFISFYFLAPTMFTLLIKDRVIDTAIGSVLAGLVSSFVFPVWGKESTYSLITNCLVANANYFMGSTKLLLGDSITLTTFDNYRKDVQIALANMSDNFQKMLSEPKNKQLSIVHYHQFTSTSHLLISYIASISYYGQTLQGRFVENDLIFHRYTSLIQSNFDRCEALMKGTDLADIPHRLKSLPENHYLNEQLKASKDFITKDFKISKQILKENELSSLQLVQSLFEMIFNLTNDQFSILEKMKAASLVS